MDTKAQTIVKALLHFGWTEVRSPSGKYRKLTKGESTYWVGKSGALRAGRTSAKSVSISHIVPRLLRHYYGEMQDNVPCDRLVHVINRLKSMGWIEIVSPIVGYRRLRRQTDGAKRFGAANDVAWVKISNGTVYAGLADCIPGNADMRLTVDQFLGMEDNDGRS